MSFEVVLTYAGIFQEMPCVTFLSAWGAITKYCGWGGLNNKVFSHTSISWTI